MAVCRCFGVDNLSKDTLLRGLLKDGDLGLRALVHRDRDFMTDDDTKRWLNLYKTQGVTVRIAGTELRLSVFSLHLLLDGDP